MKKLICLILALVLVLPTGAFAFRDRVIERKDTSARNITSKYDVFCLDYSKMVPGDDTGVSTSSLVNVVTTKGLSGNNQSALCIEDNVAGTAYSGTKVQKNFTAVSKGTIAAEMQFKFEKKTDPFLALGIYLRSGNTQANRFFVRGAGDGTLQMTDDAGSSFNYDPNVKFQPGVWYNLRFEIDLDNSFLQTEMTMYYPEGKKFAYKESLKLYTTFKAGMAIDNLLIETRQYDGYLYFDYIKVEAGMPLTDLSANKVKPEPIPLPYTATPGAGAVAGITNVTYNGEYMYFTQAPVLEGDDLMVTLRNAIRALGFKESYEDGKYVGTKGESTIEVTPGSTAVKYNGNSYTLDKAPTSERIPVVSLTDLAEVIGASCTYDAVNNVYVITDAEVAQ